MLENLNNEQKEAVLSDADFLIIEAGAGTGKTKTLTTKIAKLISDGINPKAIMATTFTRKAAAEMKERVAKTIGQQGFDVNIGTMHSFCFKLMKKYNHLLNIGHDFNIAFNDEQKTLVEMAISDFSNYPEDMDANELKEIKRQNNKFFSDVVFRWKENGLTIDEVNERLKTEQNENIIAMCNIFVRYNELLRERFLVDPSDLTIVATYLLSNKDILNEETRDLKYLLVDEFQDTNMGQLNLIRLLVSNNTKLVVVGDDDQSLYSFRGSIPSLMSNISHILSDIYDKNQIHTVRLIRNYRSTNNILRPANTLVDYNENHMQNPKILESDRNGDEVDVAVFGTAKQEAVAIAKSIKEMHTKKKISYSEIAILSRQNRCLTNIEIELQSKNIPYILNSGLSFFDRTEICDVLSYFQLALNPELDIALQRIIARPTRNVGASSADVISHRTIREDIPAYEIIFDMLDQNQFRGNKAQEGARKLAKDLQYIHEIYANNGTPYEIISYILIDMGYKSWVENNQKDENRQKKSDNLGILLNIAKDSETIEIFMENTGLSGYDKNVEDAVFLGSIHGSKGLEWDNVFIVAFEKNIIPSSEDIYNSDNWEYSPWNLDDGSGIEEERRLAHVALTRARNIAKISFALTRPGGPENRNPGPSRFIKDADLQVPEMKSLLENAKRNSNMKSYWSMKKAKNSKWG